MAANSLRQLRAILAKIRAPQVPRTPRLTGNVLEKARLASLRANRAVTRVEKLAAANRDLVQRLNKPPITRVRRAE